MNGGPGFDDLAAETYVETDAEMIALIGRLITNFRDVIVALDVGVQDQHGIFLQGLLALSPRDTLIHG